MRTPGRGLVSSSRSPLARVVATCVVVGALAVPRSGEAKDAKPAKPAGWWDRAWSHRRPLTLSPAGPLAPRTAFASLTTHGALRADGQDLRVVSPGGSPVGVEMLWVGPGDTVSFFFDAGEGGASPYHAYWGNPRPKDVPPAAWSRDGGLVCEVRSWEDAFPVDSEAGASLALARAVDVEARVLRRKIFDAGNPGGPSPTYVATYRGFFRVPTEADYDLCTVSSDASLLRVAGREVPLWSRFRGPHSAQRGRFSTRVHLAAGNHPIEYVHFAAGGEPRAAEVGIKKASEAQWRVLWDADYVQPVPAQPGLVETSAGPAPADFAWTTVQHMEAGGRYLLRVEFEALGAPEGARCEWEFGDGRRGEGARVVHAFVGRGVRTVRLTVGSGKGAAQGTQRVAVDPLWTQAANLFPGSEKRWAEDLALAVADGLLPEEIEPALAAAQALLSDDLLRSVARSAFDRAPGLAGAVRTGIFLTLAEFFDDPRTRDDAGQTRALALALDAPGAPPLDAARAALAAADHAMRWAGDARAALAHLETLGARRADRAGLSDADARRASLVRIDALLSLGRLEEAKAVLARTDDVGPRDERVADASRRARLHAATARLAAGAAGDAAGEVRTILDDFPGERFRPEAPLLLAEAYLHLGEARGAAALLERVLRLEPDGAHAPRALLLLSRARERLGDAAAAATARARLLAEFPYADEAAEAGRRAPPGR